MDRLKRRIFKKPLNKERFLKNTGEMYPLSYLSNRINNCKYNFFSFLPVFLYNEYRHFSNFYFLFVTLIQIYKPFRVGFIIADVGPLIVITTLSLLKEIWDEIKRKRKDKDINKEKFIKLTCKGEEEVLSENIKEGDFLIIKKNQRVPADMILLYTKDKSGTSFVRTDQLDGETDWKVRESIKFTQKLGQKDISNIIKKRWKTKVEAPNDLIYKFKGCFYTEGGVFESLQLKNTIWANMKVATGEIIGIIIYCGAETKMALNNKKPIKKYGKTDKEINLLTKLLFFILFILATFILFLSGNIILNDWIIYLVRVFLLFSFIIPISMKVNVDFAKLYYSFLINKDDMIKNTIARNSSIPEELGRIQYLLSDKTGTLTKNEMIFKKLHTITGNYSVKHFDILKEELIGIHKKENSFKNENKEDPLKKKNVLTKKENILKNNFLCFMLCNNVSPVTDNNERILQASSPDEIALVNFAEKMGYLLLERRPNKIKIRTPGNFEETYEILYNFPFSSETKRMGIILKNEETKKIIFFLKGADVIIQKKVSMENNLFIIEEAGALSCDGLRTLVLTYRNLQEEELKNFKNNFEKAGLDLKNREIKETEVIERLENGMELLGISGVEDLLQEDIKSVILNLREAGIKVWMLTGDKLETAKCIAISTGFKKNNQKFFEISSSDQKIIESHINKFNHITDSLLVTGKALSTIFNNKRLKEIFFYQAQKALSVILCRCAPKQKAEVTLYLKNNLKKIVCGIGDGGNDVGMIQSANVGIGIEGKEGLQASLASDFSVIKFKNILKLFIWHGRLSYVRTALLANFVIHRGIIIVVIQALFMITFYFVSINVYNGYLIMCYSTIFTNFPVFSLILDEDIPIKQVFHYPMLYYLVQEGQNLSPKVFLIWLWKSIFQGSVIILMALFLFNDTFLEIVTITFTALIINEFLNIYSSIRTWHPIITISLCISAISYLFCLIFLKKLFLLSSLNFEKVLKIFFLSFCSWLPIHIMQVIRRLYFPSQIDKVLREAKLVKKRNIQGNHNDITLYV